MWVEIWYLQISWVPQKVILFVRMWVEISSGGQGYATITVILFVRMWVEIKSNVMRTRTCKSHPLREDVSWNSSMYFHLPSRSSHPLREDVSWNLSSFLPFFYCCRHPLREDVSWNTWENILSYLVLSHPLREDVSWNVNCQIAQERLLSSSSSWGCELKYVCGWHSSIFKVVILFVRMWVEMQGVWRFFIMLMSSSSWGCELKFSSSITELN